MKHLHHLGSAILLGLIAATPATSLAQTEPSGFYATLYGQLSRLGSTGFNETGNAGFGSGLTAEFGTGFGFGGDVGYRYGNGWATEIEWNWRRHDVTSLRRGSTTIAADGDFASNILFVNGLRRFVGFGGGWTPYVGAGVGWVEEIDFDLSSAGTGRAWSTQGKIGVQLIGGAEIPLGEKWRLVTDLRVLRVGDDDMPAEGSGTGRLSKPSYNPMSVQLGLRRMF